MYRIGIDIGGTKISVGIVDRDLNVVSKHTFKTNVEAGADAISDDIADSICKLLSDGGYHLYDIERIGIGAPGVVDVERKIVRDCPNLFITRWYIATRLERHTGINTFVDNDANAAVYGEFIAGCGRGFKNIVGITVGTGIGSGIIIDGKLYRGHGYLAGEIGHMVIRHNGNACNCGKRGCFESYASATALIRMTENAIKNKECDESFIGKAARMGDITGKTAFDAMRKGDKLGTEIVNEYLDYLACGISNIISILSPELLFIGGGVSSEGDSLVTAVKLRVALDYPGLHTKICVASLGNDAGIVGAAYLSG